MPEVDKTKLEGIDELVIQWAQWDPANYLQEIGNMFEEQTGVKVGFRQGWKYGWSREAWMPARLSETSRRASAPS